MGKLDPIVRCYRLLWPSFRNILARLLFAVCQSWNADNLWAVNEWRVTAWRWKTAAGMSWRLGVRRLVAAVCWYVARKMHRRQLAAGRPRSVDIWRGCVRRRQNVLGAARFSCDQHGTVVWLQLQQDLLDGGLYTVDITIRATAMPPRIQHDTIQNVWHVLKPTVAILPHRTKQKNWLITKLKK